LRFFVLVHKIQPGPDLAVPVAARCKTWVCGRSLAGIVGSNPAGDMDVSFLCVVCCQVEVSASGSSLAHSSPTVDGVSECDRKVSKADTTGRSGGKKRERGLGSSHVVGYTKCYCLQSVI